LTPDEWDGKLSSDQLWLGVDTLVTVWKMERIDAFHTMMRRTKVAEDRFKALEFERAKGRAFAEGFKQAMSEP
jgi:hypothetical protein